MRNTKACPKCKSTDIVRIPGTVEPYGAGNFIKLGLWPIPTPAKVTRYLCGACGFSEEWVESAADIAKIKKKYGS